MNGPTGGEPMLCTRGLTKLYGVVLGVNDVTLELPRGVFGVLGPNGSGKSTLLKLVTGQLRPTEGSVRVFGEDPWNRPSMFRRVGLCPEQDAFYAFLTAHEFVGSLARLSGFGAAEAMERAAAALDRVGAAAFRDRPIATYSKGMRQRTKLAQALVHDPELLVLDEPLTGMDPVARRDTVELVRSLGREGKSLLVSSHVLHEVEAMTDSFVLVHGGRVLASGDIASIRGELAEVPHRVRLEVGDARRAAARLLAELPVDRVELDEPAGEISIDTRGGAAFFDGLARLVEGGEIEVRSMEARDDDLAALFRLLVDRVSAEARA